MDIITTTPALENLCAELAHDEFVAVDTEFMREQTFWPILCLIQIAGSRREAVIDPLSPDIDLSAFYALMADEKVVKVFHAARQDVEIIFVAADTIPKPLFDTQVAAMVCGFGEQVSYEGLVRSLAKAKVDKSSRFTDWSRRPLSERQLAYALSDVTHLRTIYVKLKAQLDRSGREPWLQEEMAVLTSPKTYQSDPRDAWRRIKFRTRSRRQLAVLAKVTEWREQEAQSRDVPRGRVIKDDVLVELAVQAPRSLDDMKNLRALPKGFSGSRFAEPILEAIEAALAAPEADWPALGACDRWTGGGHVGHHRGAAPGAQDRLRDRRHRAQAGGQHRRPRSYRSGRSQGRGAVQGLAQRRLRPHRAGTDPRRHGHKPRRRPPCPDPGPAESPRCGGMSRRAGTGSTCPNAPS
jgi:ribonuclease D